MAENPQLRGELYVVLAKRIVYIDKVVASPNPPKILEALIEFINGAMVVVNQYHIIHTN